MKQISKWIMLLCFTISLIVTGCASHRVTIGHENAQQLPKELAKDYAVYAMMASNAYLDPNRIYFKLDKLGWEKVDSEGQPIPITNYKDTPSYKPSWIGKIFSSLQYDIWKNKNDAKTVIAFKGTDEKIDWLTNFWIGPCIAYKSAKKHVKKYKERLEEKGEDREIVVVGHSLGGGLTISCSLWLGVDAYAFNSSPRVFDGWKDNKESATRKAIFQEKEILSILRSLWPKFHDVINEEDIYQTNFIYNGVKDNSHRADYLAEGILRCSTNDPELVAFAKNVTPINVTCNLQ